MGWRGAEPEPGGALGAARRLAYWDGRSWRERSGRSGAWRNVSGFPAWLDGEEHWLARLCQRAPKLRWLVGRGLPSGWFLAVQGGIRGEFCWVHPLTEEAGPR
ncbi:MAG: hypothetical protein ACM3XS_06015 [Bacteroidota bacterium]